MWRSLHPAVRALWWWGGLLTGGAVGAILGLAVALVSGAPDVGAGAARVVAGTLAGLGCGALHGRLLVGRRYAAWRYRFGPEALELERGVWWRTSSAVPYQRIQQVEIEHGPVQRRLGIVGLSLRTASASSLGSIPGLSASEAGELRTWLLRRAGADDGA